MAPAPRIRPYKDFLTPALHRRFAMATATLFGLCYVESVWIGEKNSFIWSWFPLGRAGIRTGLLFISAFMIFILRVAQLHVGIRTSYSPLDTFKAYATKFQVVQTLGWYCLSAYFFSEVYIWSAPKDAGLNRIVATMKTDRAVVNEKPVYLTCYLLFLAVLQAAWHLFFDYDRIDMPATKTKMLGDKAAGKSPIASPAMQMRGRMPGIAVSAFARSFVMTLASPFIYCLTVRSFAWSFTRFWSRIFWNLNKSTALPDKWPFHWTMFWYTFVSGFLLVMLWEVGNAAFSTYVAQEPLKNERPITYESRDPNGSLLTGLKGKKLQTRAFAFWELVYIAERFEGRRKVIFEDIDRSGGSTWSQILAVCLEVINGIDLRIAEYQRPPPESQPQAAALPAEGVPGLPRLTQPMPIGIKEPGDLFNKPRKVSATNAVDKLARSYGQSPPGALSPKARKLLKQAEKIALTPEQQKKVDTAGFPGLFREWALWVIKSPVGWPFRQLYRRKLAAVVLGQPYGDVGIIVDAIDSVTRFSVCSLKEDKYGNVQRDVKLIIQTLTNAVLKLEAFKQNLGFHWTDTKKKTESPEVDLILEVLKSGLNELVEAFGDYSQDLRLSQSEMRMAREAATPMRKARKPEMEQAGR